MTDRESLLTAHDIGVTFNGTPVLSHISFTLQRGETVAMVGPNGSGKSVLLRALLGLVPHTGTAIWASDIRLAYLPQFLSAARDLPLTVDELFALRHIAPEVMAEYLAHVEMDAPAVRTMPIGQLSGGQFQRVMIAWAVAQHPDVLLFDEPAGGIDIAGQTSVYKLIRHIQEVHNIAILLVSHDLDIVYRYADQVLCINQTMVCHGMPDDVLTPDAIAQLYGTMHGLFRHHEHHDH